MSLFKDIMDKIEREGYICPECGEQMEFADDNVLVCRNEECKFSCDKDDYFDTMAEEEGFYDTDDAPEDYESVYETYEDL